MRKFFLMACSLGVLSLAVSCKDDDGGKLVGSGSGTASYDGDTYNLKNGFIGDYGPDGDHYNYDFNITDGTIDLENEVINGASIYIYADLYSPGTNGFKTGTFTFDDDGDVDGEYVLDYADITLDSNNDGKINANDQWIEATDGQITVTGSGNNYTLQFNLTLEDGETLTGSYTGNFRKYDEGSRRAPNGELKKSKASKL